MPEERSVQIPGIIIFGLYVLALLAVLIDAFAGAMAFIGVSVFLSITVFSLSWMNRRPSNSKDETQKEEP